MRIDDRHFYGEAAYGVYFATHHRLTILEDIIVIDLESTCCTFVFRHIFQPPNDGDGVYTTIAIINKVCVSIGFRIIRQILTCDNRIWQRFIQTYLNIPLAISVFANLHDELIVIMAECNIILISLFAYAFILPELAVIYSKLLEKADVKIISYVIPPLRVAQTT